MTESALFRACRDGNTSTARALLQAEEFDYSPQFDQLSVTIEFFLLFLEYGHRIPSACDLSDKQSLVANFDHDLTLLKLPCYQGLFEQASFVLLDVDGKVTRCRFMHHMLRVHGEFYPWISFDMCKWIADNKDIAQCNNTVLEDLQAAIIFTVSDDDVMVIANIVSRSSNKDWFLSFLSCFDVHLNDSFMKDVFRLHLYYEADLEQQLRFLVNKCHTDVDMKVEDRGQTLLMLACQSFFVPIGVVSCLLDLGADVNAVDSQGLTALDYAVKLASDELFIFDNDEFKHSWIKIAMLLEAGAEFGPKSSNTFDDLMRMARDNKTNQAEILQMLEMKVAQ